MFPLSEACTPSTLSRVSCAIEKTAQEVKHLEQSIKSLSQKAALDKVREAISQETLKLNKAGLTWTDPPVWRRMIQMGHLLTKVTKQEMKKQDKRPKKGKTDIQHGYEEEVHVYVYFVHDWGDHGSESNESVRFY